MINYVVNYHVEVKSRNYMKSFFDEMSRIEMISDFTALAELRYSIL